MLPENKGQQYVVYRLGLTRGSREPFCFWKNNEVTMFSFIFVIFYTRLFVSDVVPETNVFNA